MWSLVAQQLENARSLVKLDEQLPNEAALRRAVSTAYYALFQALCDVCASTLVGRDKPWETFTPIFRALEHKATAQALLQKRVSKATEFEGLGLIFEQLQTARQWADYNPEPRLDFEARTNESHFTRNEAFALIEQAEKAVQDLDRLDEETRLVLATRLVTKSRK